MFNVYSIYNIGILLIKYLLWHGKEYNLLQVLYQITKDHLTINKYHLAIAKNHLIVAKDQNAMPI